MRPRPHVFRLSAPALARSLMALAVLVLAPRATSAQDTTATPRAPASGPWRLAFVGGASFQSYGRDGDLSHLGPTVGLAVARTLHRRSGIGLSAAAGYAHYGERHDAIPVACAPSLPPGGCVLPPGGPVGIGTASLALRVEQPGRDASGAPTGRLAYMTLGPMVARALQHPVAAGATRLGAEFRSGIEAGGPDGRWLVELRAAVVPRWPEHRLLELAPRIGLAF